jgi:thymidylate kinase
MMKYKQTPIEIIEIINLFHKNNLKYILFKCEHIFEGTNKNLDILFTDEDYKKAASLLEKNGFVLRFSERFEKYKLMYFRYDEGKCVSIHLHREIAWHGIKILDKSLVFERREKLSEGIFVPSLEDYILIHAGHVLFENFVITSREKNYFFSYLFSSVDKEYIYHQLNSNYWRSGFEYIVNLDDKASKLILMISWSKKLIFEPLTLSYVLFKVSRLFLRKFDYRRKGCLITFSGVNGSGKSSLSRKIIEIYDPILTHFGMKKELVYFGWKSTFFLTKWISSIFKKRDKNIFKEVINLKVPKFSIYQEVLFVYIYLEFLYRYHAEVRAFLYKNTFVITDRYFYDIYGQYPYSKNSMILKLLLIIFPKPTKSYVLDAPLSSIMNRDKTDKSYDGTRTLQRSRFSEEYLMNQKSLFMTLPEFLDVEVVDTSSDIYECSKKLVEDTWRCLV